MGDEELERRNEEALRSIPTEPDERVDVETSPPPVDKDVEKDE